MKITETRATIPKRRVALQGQTAVLFSIIDTSIPLLKAIAEMRCCLPMRSNSVTYTKDFDDTRMAEEMFVYEQEEKKDQSESQQLWEPGPKPGESSNPTPALAEQDREDEQAFTINWICSFTDAD